LQYSDTFPAERSYSVTATDFFSVISITSQFYFWGLQALRLISMKLLQVSWGIRITHFNDNPGLLLIIYLTNIFNNAFIKFFLYIYAGALFC
jgi:hypothetical protein